MSMMVGIEAGLIVVTQPVPAERWSFADEDEAVDMLAEKSCEDGESVDFFASCESPGENGRPGFSKLAFLDRLQDSIYEIRSASAPRM